MTGSAGTVAGTVAGIIDAAEDFGSAPAVLDGAQYLSFADLVSRIRAAAAAFATAGIVPGDRIGLWGSNRVEWLIAALGAQYAGATLVPLNSRYRGHEAAGILARTQVRLLVVEQGLLGTDHVGLLKDAAAEFGAPQSPIIPAPVVPGPVSPGPIIPGPVSPGPVSPGPIIPGLPSLAAIVSFGDRAPECQDWNAFLAAGERFPAPVLRQRAAAIQPADPCDILFTSGTTGTPKGAVATHRQTLASARAWAQVAEVTAADRYLIASPFFHSFGSKAGYLVGLLTGALTVPVAVFSASSVLDLVEQERISLLPGAPALYQSLLDDPSRPGRDLSSLRLAVTGAALVPQVLVERMHTELGFGSVLTAYGLTEAAVVTMCRPGDPAQTVATSCGRAVDGVEIAIAPVSGEVLVRGATVMTGYLDDAAATAEAIDADNWLHTGDVGVLDEQGYLRITDRIKDVFMVGGFNVYPAEVEQEISRCPGVAECAVIGVPDHRLGEVPHAFVVLSPGAELTAVHVIATCRDRLANFKVPRSVVFVESLPRNASGKILKTQLRGVAE